jgi:hypothetical protein
VLVVKLLPKLDTTYFQVLIAMDTEYKFVKEKLKVLTVKDDVLHLIVKK